MGTVVLCRGGNIRPEPANRLCSKHPQSACSPLTVVCTCFGPTLRVANAFGVVRTAHALPSVAHLRKEPLGDNYGSQLSKEGAFFVACHSICPSFPAPKPRQSGAPPQSRRLEEATKQAARAGKGPCP